MTTTLKASTWGVAVALVALALFLSISQAHAQSEVTGTLTSGTAATGSTATGTITGGTGNTISGTVVAGAQCQDGIDNDGDGAIDYPDDGNCDSLTDNTEQGSSGGGGSRRSSNNNDDDGEVAGEATGPTDGVGGTGDVLVPGVPNTGAGGMTPMTLATLLGSLVALAGGAIAMRRYKVS